MATGSMTLDQLVSALDMDDVAEDHALDATMRPTIAPRYRNSKRSQPPALEERRLPEPAAESRSSHELKIKGPLAEGGMGKILLAQQGGLRRDVAVKMLKDEFLEPAFAERLLREARVLGLVEHPNIVPLYALHTDERNSPALVMKRIEGVPWRVLIADPKHPAFPAETNDIIAWHLRVFMRVCDAVHYAHSRGVLHLDLKPDNVMIGAFREVYLVDWGVAVATNSTYRGWLPMADEVNEILGTPAYLAPEMVDVAQQSLDVRTDVYLLGAVLHEILTGEPPHKGDTLQAILYAAYQAGVPDMPDDLPRELGRIVKKAMDPSRTKRFQDVEELRAAVSAFLEHRSALGLVRSARTALDELRAIVEEEPSRASGHRISMSVDRQNAHVHRLFGRSRFAFAEALRQWPESTNAALGQREVLMLMCRYHLDRGEAASAEGLLEELEQGDVTDAIRQLRENATKQRQSAAALERLQHEESAELGQAMRGKLLLAVCGLVSLPTLFVWLAQQAGYYTYAWWHTVAYSSGLWIFSGIAGYVFRKDLLANRRGSRIAIAMWMIGLMAVSFRFVTYSLGIRDLSSLAVEMTLLGDGALIAGILADRRMLYAAPGFLLATVLILCFPAHSVLWTSLGVATGPGALAIQWLRTPPGDGQNN